MSACVGVGFCFYIFFCLIRIQNCREKLGLKFFIEPLGMGLMLALMMPSFKWQMAVSMDVYNWMSLGLILYLARILSNPLCCSLCKFYCVVWLEGFCVVMND